MMLVKVKCSIGKKHIIYMMKMEIQQNKNTCI